MNATRVLLADDHAPVCAGIRALLEKLSGAEVVGEVGNGREALDLNASRDTSAITGGSPCWATGLRLVLLLLVLVSPGAVAQIADEMPRTIRVVTDNAYAPYAFQSDNGTLQGILIDQWVAFEAKTGIEVEIYAMDWGEALRRMRAGEFDVIDTIVETAERRGYFDFTPAYATIEVPIFFRTDISDITNIASVKGFPVGVKTGDQHIDKLKANGVTTVIPFQNYDAMIAAAKQHKINVFVADAPSGFYLLNKMGIEAEFRHTAPIFRDELRRAVRKGDAAMLRTVTEGFASIEPATLKQIDEKWYGHTIKRIRRYLTYAGYATAMAVLLLAGLLGWNRTLRKRILQRTAALGESEQRFRQIAENISEVFWLSNPEGTLLHYVSPAYEKIWGRSCDRVYAEPTSWMDSIHPDDRERIAQAVRLQSISGQHDLTYRIVRPDRSLRWIRDRAFPVRDEAGKLIRVAGIAEDITGRKETEEQLKQYTNLLQTFSRRLFDVQEEERRHLARELHDEIGQTLTAAKINLQSVTANGDTANVARLQETTAILDRLLGQVRQISLDLRPSMLDDLGLVPALRSLLDQQGRRASMEIRFSAENLSESLDAKIQTTCFRIAQEAITNASRHAHATRVEVDLRRDDGSLRLRIRDNGSGFVVESAQAQTVGLGLIGIKERAALIGGRAKIISSPNKGTTIEVFLPLTLRSERQGRHP